MNRQDCIKFANENPLCYLATSQDNQPYVRALGFWFADDSGFYFQTASVKEFYHQLKLNPNTEVCFYKHEGFIGTMLRIQGNVEFLDDRYLKEKVLNDRPFLKNYGLHADSSSLIIFRISQGKAHFWPMENNLKTKEYLLF